MKTEFNNKQYNDIYPNNIGNHYWPHSRNMMILDAIGENISNKWIEIGCGRGVVIEYLRKRGVEIFGVELANVDPIAAVSDVIDFGLRAEDLRQSYRDSFDGILLLDVIEHIEDSVGFLRSVAENIRNAQTLIVSVPARPEIWSNYDNHVGHFRRYTREMLCDELQQAGWRPLWIEYRFRALYPPAWILLRTLRSRSTVIRAPSKHMRIFHRLLAFMLWAESRAPLGPLPGTSILARAVRG